MSSEVRRSLRRIKTAEHSSRLGHRDPASMPWTGQLQISQLQSAPKFLLDTTVYIDQLQGKLPRELEITLRPASFWHSTVTECELAALIGLLDPNHPGSARIIEEVASSIDSRPPHRIINPDREVWREAGILAGMLARLQQYGKAEQRRALNDALILLSAAKAGLTVLTRNVSDFDLLQQLAPHGNILFYQTSPGRI